jgi:hypothetical protein
VNASILHRTGEIKAQWYPSGEYKVLFKASDDSDENIFTIEMRQELHLHLNDPEF